MYQIVRKRLIILLFLVLVVCAAVLLLRAADHHKADAIYKEAERMATTPEVPVSTLEPSAIVEPDTSCTEEPAPVIDLTPLQEVNPDVVGWIEIPGVLSYPVLQGVDNAYYLSHTWNREENPAGAIFMDYRASTNLNDFQTLIYGHRMSNGTMFGSLKEYADADFWQLHPAVFITTANSTYQYDIFAAYKIDVSGIVYQCNFSDTENKQALIQYALAHSQIETSLVPTTEDSIMTLSTCAGSSRSTRWVVQAVLSEVL